MAVGRKNFLFVGLDAGERRWQTPRRRSSGQTHGLDPEVYLRDVLARINDHKINRLDELVELDPSGCPTGSGGLSMAAIAHVLTLARVANLRDFIEHYRADARRSSEAAEAKRDPRS